MKYLLVGLLATVVLADVAMTCAADKMLGKDVVEEVHPFIARAFVKFDKLPIALVWGSVVGLFLPYLLVKYWKAAAIKLITIGLLAVSGYSVAHNAKFYAKSAFVKEIQQKIPKNPF